jgi:hypothetical protein
MSVFDSPALNRKTVGDVLFRPLDEAGTIPKVVDVGAQNGMGMLPEAFTS